MIQSPKWKKIKRYGLSKYEMNKIGEIRLTRSRKIIKDLYDNNKENIIHLYFFGRPTTFKVAELLLETFDKHKIYKVYDSVPNIEIPENYKQLSENEDDYGGKGGGEWVKIREKAKVVTNNREVEKTNVDYKGLV